MSGGIRTICPHYDTIDAILGVQAASCPPTILDSGGGSHSEQPMSETPPDAEEGQFSLLVEEKKLFAFHQTFRY